MCVDIGNAYINTVCIEKMWCKSGPELEVGKGSVLIIVRVLYGFNSEEAACRSMLSKACGMITFQWITGEKNLEDYFSKTTTTKDLCYISVQ